MILSHLKFCPVLPHFDPGVGVGVGAYFVNRHLIERYTTFCELLIMLLEQYFYSLVYKIHLFCAPCVFACNFACDVEKIQLV